MLKSAENAFLAVLNAAIPNVASQMEPRYFGRTSWHDARKRWRVGAPMHSW